MVALGLAIILSGCGGDSQAADEGTASSSGAVSSKAQFIEKADKICAQADGRQIRMRTAYLVKHPNAEKSEAGQVRIVKTVALPPISREVTELAQLDPPTEGGEEIEALISELEELIREAEENPKGVVEGAWSPAAAEAKAKKLGFDACATPS